MKPLLYRIVFFLTVVLILFNLAQPAQAAVALIASPKKNEPKVGVVPQDLPVFSVVNAACTDKEMWQFSAKIPPAWRKKFAENPNGLVSSEETYSWAFALLKSGRSIESKTIADYWMARSLYQLKLMHLAQRSFIELFLRPSGVETDAVRFAALDCMNRIHRAYPTIVYSTPVVESIKSTQVSGLTLERKQSVWEAVTAYAKSKFASTQDINTPDVASELAVLAGSGPYEALINALLFASKNADAQTIQWSEKFLAYGQAPRTLPEVLYDQQDALRLTLGRAYFNLGNFDRAIRSFRSVKRSSNYFAQALSDLSWAYLAKHQYNEAASVGFNLLEGGLSRTFAPEAPIVVSIAQFETCHIPDSLKSIRYFRKKYERTYKWLHAWTTREATDSQKLYGELVEYLKKKTGIPDKVATEWIRSPLFVFNQSEINLMMDEKDVIRNVNSDLQKYGKVTRDKTRKQAQAGLRASLATYLQEIPAIEAELVKQVNKDLGIRNKTMLTALADVAENSQLIEVEIFNAAGEDIIVENLRPDEKKLVAAQNKANRVKKDEPSTLDWGRFLAKDGNEDESEVWEDEVGSLRTDVSDNCPKN